MQRGYVKMWRKSLDSPVWKNPDLWRFWTWCILKATHAPLAELVGFQCIALKPGEFVFGRKVAARETGLSERTVRTCIDTLSKLGNLTITSTNKFSILTIEKWEDYQSSDQLETSKTTSKRPASDHIQAQQAQEEEQPLVSEDGDSSHSPVGERCARTKKRAACPHQEIIAAYHEALPELPVVQSFGEPAKRTLRARWAEQPGHQSLDFWRALFASISASDFLMGRAKDWRCPGLLWIIGPRNFAKILNGHYGNHGPSTGSTLTDANARAAQQWLSEGVKQ